MLFRSFWPQKLIFLLFFMVSWVIGVPFARAHELQIDRGVTVLLHIDPEDQPVAGQSSHLLASVTDKGAAFDLNHCNCSLTILKNNQQLFTAHSISATYVFPEAGDYTVEIKGAPVNGVAFQSFDVKFNETVLPSSSHRSWYNYLGPHTTHYIIFGIGFLIVGYMIVLDKFREIKQQKTRN